MRGPPPSRPRLCASETARARSHRAQPPRPRGGVGLSLASCGGGERWHTAGSLGCPGRALRRPACGRQTPQPWSPCGHPCRCSVGETATWVTSQGRGAVATAGGSGCGDAHPRSIGGQPPAMGSHDVSALAIVSWGQTLKTGRCTRVVQEDHGDLIERVLHLIERPMLTRAVALYKQETTP